MSPCALILMCICFYKMLTKQTKLSQVSAITTVFKAQRLQEVVGPLVRFVQICYNIMFVQESKPELLTMNFR